MAGRRGSQAARDRQWEVRRKTRSLTCRGRQKKEGLEEEGVRNHRKSERRGTDQREAFELGRKEPGIFEDGFSVVG